ncbi:OPT oligopeptide transporter protein-domain-containing protein [Lipomyces oligophaga]|uniref:OPT oligopeptide transporter protein-domain-containing protein n=1 Tax=Lipomyces oligophaga TaxID=45792 RepID=UPI0034D0145E
MASLNSEEEKQSIPLEFPDTSLPDSISATDVSDAAEKLNLLSVEDSISILKSALEYHSDDANFSEETSDHIRRLLQRCSEKNADFYLDDVENQIKNEAALIALHSPYSEVRSVTSPLGQEEDDESDSTYDPESFRVYLLAVIWTIIGAGVNQFFSTRQPQFSLTTDIMQLLIYPCGKVLEYLPDWGFSFRQVRYSLNHGPWSYKEQMLCTVYLATGISIPYVTQANIIVQKSELFYGHNYVTTGYQFLLVLSTQFLGYGMAGILRRWAVYPIKAVWPTSLPTLALSRALVSPSSADSQPVNGWTWTRYKFFFVIVAISFAYQWVPSFLFPALSYFDWLTWISPNNFNLAAVTGSFYGLGFNPISSFDWSVIGASTPLAAPFFTYFNQYIGMLLSAFAILAMYYTNYRWTAYIPINTNSLISNTGDSYDVSAILINGTFNEALYQQYSPAFYSAGYLMYYGSLFAIYPALIIWTLLWHWRSLIDLFQDIFKSLFRRRSYRMSYTKFDDPFMHYMSRLKEVPDWWFLCVLVIAFVLGVVCLTHFPTETSVGGFVLVIVINFVFLIPLALLQATTGAVLGLNILTELISGYMYQGNGSALMLLKAFGVVIDGQATAYITNLKLAHYSKIPPRSVFRGQLFMTLISCIVSIGVLNWQMGHITDFCDSAQEDYFSCPNAWTFFSASIVWGVIGPARTFNHMYPILPWCFLIGALIILPFYFGRRFFPRIFTPVVHPILVIYGMNIWAPYNLSYYTPGLYLSFTFMYYIKRRYVGWWEKYNYVLSAGLGAGCAFSLIIIFFAVQYKYVDLSWWGTNVLNEGIEAGYGQQALLAVPERGYFGPALGEYP